MGRVFVRVEGGATHPPMKSLIPCNSKECQRRLRLVIHKSTVSIVVSFWVLLVLWPSAARGFPPPSVWGGAGRRRSPAGWSAPWPEWAPPPAAGASPLSASAVCPWRVAPPPAGNPSGGWTLLRPAPLDLRLAPGQQRCDNKVVKVLFCF